MTHERFVVYYWQPRVNDPPPEFVDHRVPCPERNLKAGCHDPVRTKSKTGRAFVGGRGTLKQEKASPWIARTFTKKNTPAMKYQVYWGDTTAKDTFPWPKSQFH